MFLDTYSAAPAGSPDPPAEVAIQAERLRSYVSCSLLPAAGVKSVRAIEVDEERPPLAKDRDHVWTVYPHDLS